jgi:hypothetical protein
MEAVIYVLNFVEWIKTVIYKAKSKYNQALSKDSSFSFPRLTSGLTILRNPFSLKSTG